MRRNSSLSLLQTKTFSRIKLSNSFYSFKTNAYPLIDKQIYKEMLKNKLHSYFKRKTKIGVEIHICVFFKRKLLAE